MGPQQYIKLEHRSGSVEHLRGPLTLWLNPTKHTRAEVCEMVQLKSELEVLVVYQQQNTPTAADSDVVEFIKKIDAAAVESKLGRADAVPDGVVSSTRRVIQGPAFFM